MNLERSTVQAHIIGCGVQRTLIVRADRADSLADYEGRIETSADAAVLTGPLTSRNATAIRRDVPHLAPRPLGTARSAGVGDRLGLATVGHARAFARAGHGIIPVFAQQSAREARRLGRTPREVLDAATFGALDAGWHGPVGADADHLKTINELTEWLAAGFTTFTLDPGDHVRNNARSEDAEEAPWDALEDSVSDLRRRYARIKVPDADGGLRGIENHEVLRAAAKYGGAVAHAVRMARCLREQATQQVEIEISVDETAEVTSFVEHVYLATELARLGVEWVSFAPRYIGDFEKGVEYAGDRVSLARNLAGHRAIAAEHGGYKLSLHSGSDKFSIYPLARRASAGAIHLKTSGTSYLVALEAAACAVPELFREIYRVSRDDYRDSRTSYHVSASIEETPAPDAIADAALPALLVDRNVRQILHVGYGAVLRSPDGSEASELDHHLRQALSTNHDLYLALLDQHLGRHLQPFAD
jgi:hypothetical protein